MSNDINKIQIKYSDGNPRIFIDEIEIKGISEYIYKEKCFGHGVDRELTIKLGDFDIEISEDKKVGETDGKIRNS